MSGGRTGTRRPRAAASCAPDALSFEPVVPESFDIVHCYGLLVSHRRSGRGAWRQSRANAPDCCCSRPASRSAATKRSIPCRSGRIFPRSRCRVSDAGRRGRGCSSACRSCSTYAYVPRTQPAHEDFPLDWTGAQPTDARGARGVHRVAAEVRQSAAAQSGARTSKLRTEVRSPAWFPRAAARGRNCSS